MPTIFFLGVGGATAAVNWIIEHSNESDFESDGEAEVPAMGGNKCYRMVIALFSVHLHL